jgi:raffinose/stachyose/melibiose transport system permease protein
MNAKTLALRVGVYLVLIFTVFISAYPLFWVLTSAFKTNAEILNTPFALPTRLDFSSFAQVLSKYNFLGYAANSLFTAGSSTLVSLLFYAMAGYVFAKFRFPGRQFLFTLFVITMMVPGMAKVQPIFSLLNRLHLYDSLAGLAFVYVSGGISMSLFVLRTAFAAIPFTLDEAAILDGAGFFKRFWLLNLPLAGNGLVTAGILMFLGNWNEFYYASLLTASPGNRTLPVTLSFFNETFTYDYSKLFAALTIVILPGLLVYVLAQERIRVSVMSSGIKG